MLTIKRQRNVYIITLKFLLGMSLGETQECFFKKYEVVHVSLLCFFRSSKCSFEN